jgi:hypothetical protein
VTRAILRGILLIGGERIPVEFAAESADRIGRALAVGEVAKRRQIERSVRGYRAMHPYASANELVRVLGGNRRDVLAIDRAVTGREKREGGGSRSQAQRLIPSDENQPDEGVS